MEIPILDGVYMNSGLDIRTAYPRNMMPVAKGQSVSRGYLRPADGIIESGEGPGVDRGAINWKGYCYRVMGTKLVRIEEDESCTVLVDVGGTDQVTIDYSFDYLAISSSGKLYYWDGTTLQQNTDPDLGTVIDFIWIDGYFVTTDGESLVSTELNDPLSVNPLKYGSSEIDPDPIKAVLKLRNELIALNRYTIEIFNNVGGDGFPFTRIDGAQIHRGILGTYCADIFNGKIAFIGSGRNEAPAIYIGLNSDSEKISTREIELVLEQFTEEELASSVVESRISKGVEYLYVHLPNQTWVFDAVSTKVLEELVWFQLTSSIVGESIFRARNIVWCYNKWLVGDPISSKYGYLDDTVLTHYGEPTGWEFSAAIIYNNSKSGIVHELELVGLPGRAELNKDPVVWTSYSNDGVVFSVEKALKTGKIGERNKRIRWVQQGMIRNFRIQKFRGTSDTKLSIMRLEATLEALNV